MKPASAFLLGLIVTAASPAPAQSASGAAPSQLPRATFVAEMDGEFRKMDANGDKVVSKAELEASQRHAAAAAAAQRVRLLFKQLDEDSDGKLTAREFESLAATESQSVPNVLPMLERFDGNRDGRISLVEYRAATQANFDRMDADRDGVVSAAELKAAGIVK
jgi:hypothetical protein